MMPRNPSPRGTILPAPRRRLDRTRAWTSRLLLAAALGGELSGANQPDVMRYRHNAPESPHDHRYRYQWNVLQAALDQTKPEFGAYVLEAAPVMNEQRQLFEMQQDSGVLSIIYLDASPAAEASLHPVRIPVDKGLVGFRVLLIGRDRQADFESVRSLADLRRFRLGAGAGWADVDILRASQLEVVTGSSYDGLFAMLEHGRFDAFPRGANEILGEMAVRAGQFPRLAIEEHLLIHFPLPMYFWFARTDEGRRLARRVEVGMRRMLENGSFDTLFEAAHREAIERLRLPARRLIRLSNPYLAPETPLADRRLWFDPGTYVTSTR